MVEQAAEDYAKILQSVNLAKEINPICTNIDDMLARLDEFETLLSNVKAETNGIMENHVSGIIAFSDNFQIMRERIDKLENFVEVVKTNVDELEHSLDVAEEELNVTDYSLKGLLLKPLLAKAKGTTATTGDGDAETVRRSNLQDGEFQPLPIFRSSEFFVESRLHAEHT